MSSDIPSFKLSPQPLTPCAGRCSTVFGDVVCRGCRRFNHEVIAWNRYDAYQQQAVWQRLDQQLDQTLLPLLPQANLIEVKAFLQHKKVRLHPTASAGRLLYHALKICEKSPHLVSESGLHIVLPEVRPLWHRFEERVLQLAQANYEVSWLRAYAISGDESNF